VELHANKSVRLVQLEIAVPLVRKEKPAFAERMLLQNDFTILNKRDTVRSVMVSLAEMPTPQVLAVKWMSETFRDFANLRAQPDAAKEQEYREGAEPLCDGFKSVSTHDSSFEGEIYCW
jgi:hypothetical protein